MTKGMLKKTRFDAKFELKSVDESGLFAGYGSVFGNLDWWDDIVEPGAFTKSLAVQTPALLWQHDSEKPIGVWTTLREDDKGLYCEGKLLVGEVALATEAHALLKAGALSGLSIGYSPLEWEYRKDGAREVRVLKEVDLWEISLVTFPANDLARVGSVKSVEDLGSLREIEEHLREAGCSRAEAKALIARVRELSRRDAVEAACIEAAQRLLKSMKGE